MVDTKQWSRQSSYKILKKSLPGRMVKTCDPSSLPQRRWETQIMAEEGAGKSAGKSHGPGEGAAPVLSKP